jgi:hypothetical protein
LLLEFWANEEEENHHKESGSAQDKQRQTQILTVNPFK